MKMLDPTIITEHKHLDYERRLRAIEIWLMVGLKDKKEALKIIRKNMEEDLKNG